MRKYAERKQEVKQARKKWIQWEEEKAEVQRQKIKTQKALQVKTIFEIYEEKETTIV